MGVGELHDEKLDFALSPPCCPVDAVSYGTSVDSSSVDERITMAPVEEAVSESVEERSLVKKSLHGNIGTITLDNPPKHNALGAALIGELLLALSDLTNAGARAIVLRAYKGAKVWSAGHDVRELPTNGRDPLTYDDPLRRVVRVIKESPTPIIAMVEGGVWGGACEMVMSCDLVIAAEGTTFAITPAKLGVPYDIEGTLSFMQSVSLPVIKEMLFTAQPMPAERAPYTNDPSSPIAVRSLNPGRILSTAEDAASAVESILPGVSKMAAARLLNPKSQFSA